MKTRDVYYDNAKFLLIFLVVFGHLIQSYIEENKFIFTLYTTIYLFHMPAFILISGFFAKGFQKKGFVLKITKKLIGPYLIFQGIYSFYYFFIHDHGWKELDPLNPKWSLWFLVSLFCWNIMLFLFTKWKVGFGIFLSITLGIIVGYFQEINTYLSMSRTIVFFPLFLIGYYFKKEYFEKLIENKMKIVSVAIFGSMVILFYYLPEFDYKWLFGSEPYDDLHNSGINGGIVRIGVYTLTILATFSFFAFVPRKNHFFTKWGTSSLYVYLLHGFFIKFFRNSELVDYFNKPWQMVILFAISLLLIAFLSSNMVIAIFQPFIELKISVLRNYLTTAYSKLKSRKLITANMDERGTN